MKGTVGKHTGSDSEAKENPMKEYARGGIGNIGKTKRSTLENKGKPSGRIRGSIEKSKGNPGGRMKGIHQKTSAML